MHQSTRHTLSQRKRGPASVAHTVLTEAFLLPRPRNTRQVRPTPFAHPTTQNTCPHTLSLTKKVLPIPNFYDGASLFFNSLTAKGSRQFPLSPLSFSNIPIPFPFNHQVSSGRTTPTALLACFRSGSHYISHSCPFLFPLSLC
jgi:hypothetical protein